MGYAKTPDGSLIPFLPVLREDLSAAATSAEAFYARVPLHHPFRTVIGVVGECVLTANCVWSFTEHFDNTPRTRGSLFRWPPAASVWLDFADGEAIKPSKEPLLMVVQMMAGVASTTGIPVGLSPSGNNRWNIVTRVQPRLMKLSGLRKLCGEGSDMCVKSTPPMAFYPDFVRLMSSKRAGGGSRRWTAGDLWEVASDAPERIEQVYEHVMRIEQKPINSILGIDGELQPVAAQ